MHTGHYPEPKDQQHHGKILPRSQSRIAGVLKT